MENQPSGSAEKNLSIEERVKETREWQKSGKSRQPIGWKVKKEKTSEKDLTKLRLRVILMMLAEDPELHDQLKFLMK